MRSIKMNVIVAFILGFLLAIVMILIFKIIATFSSGVRSSYDLVFCSFGGADNLV